MMLTSEINSILLYQEPSTRDIFMGAFPADKIPNPVKDKKHQAIIVNTQSWGAYGSPGEHWVLIYLIRLPDSRLYGIFFDSYGRAPLQSHIKAYLVKHCSTYVYNTTTLQSVNSTVCGHFTIYVLLQLVKGHSLNQVTRFLKTLPNPDLFVLNFIQQKYTL